MFYNYSLYSEQRIKNYEFKKVCAMIVKGFVNSTVSSRFSVMH